MIFYFSATGNSAWVAQQLAEKTSDKAINILPFLKDKSLALPEFSSESFLALVFPVYAWRPPQPVLDFIKRLKISDEMHVYAVCTMGETAGNAMKYLNNLFPLSAAYSVQMPNNYIILGDRDKEAVENRKIAEAKQQLDIISEGIIKRKKEFILKKGLFPAFVTSVIGAVFPKFCRDKKFQVDQKRCISCSLCVQLCPLNNVTLVDGYPQWQGNCIHCMACLQNCPKSAIDYGNISKKRKRYSFARIKKKLPLIIK